MSAEGSNPEKYIIFNVGHADKIADVLPTGKDSIKVTDLVDAIQTPDQLLRVLSMLEQQIKNNLASYQMVESLALDLEEDSRALNPGSVEQAKTDLANYEEIAAKFLEQYPNIADVITLFNQKKTVDEKTAFLTPVVVAMLQKLVTAIDQASQAEEKGYQYLMESFARTRQNIEEFENQ